MWSQERPMSESDLKSHPWNQIQNCFYEKESQRFMIVIGDKKLKRCSWILFFYFECDDKIICPSPNNLAAQKYHLKKTLEIQKKFDYRIFDLMILLVWLKPFPNQAWKFLFIFWLVIWKVIKKKNIWDQEEL